MTYFTSNTYQLKREILNFSKKLSHSLSKPQRKFSADMTYGIFASQSCLLTDISDSVIMNKYMAFLLSSFSPYLLLLPITMQYLIF